MSSQIPREVADIFNAPSDDEEFVCFQDAVPMENLSESCGSLDSLELEKQVRVGLSFPDRCGWMLVLSPLSASPELMVR